MSAPVQLPEVSPPLPWQYPAWEQLARQIEGATLPHALMLVAPRYTGKERFATALARLLLCEQPDGGLNCGRCRACQLTAAGSHGDFHWLGPEGKAQVIKVDSVRHAVSLASKTATHGRAKVIVFSPVEAMNVNAANALLKCLEEPTPETYMLLLAAQPHRIPATVRSRCQQLRLPAPQREQSLAWLDSATGARGESEKWLDLADGRPLLAQQLYSDPEADNLVAPRLACAALLAGEIDVGRAVAMVESSELPQVLEQVAATLRSWLASCDAPTLRGRRARALFALLDEVGDAQRAVNSGANPNRQLLCEVILEKLHFLLGGQGRDASISP
ncbi:DNA polymerase III subunit delta' [Haliea sp. E17]|uniref:DNA polymerase III subunit delta' n=1 Tax=Haliea sp. E17 TaxID=3401576 RepID=UPI003AB03011